ncbi:MAG TPA: hypothetical protein VN088_01155 [Nocardioides sp.]|nr:hypothetical protein [Nocardioides sp.]
MSSQSSQSSHRLLRRPRYAEIAATLAIVLATSGTAFAAGRVVAPGSVNTAAIRDGAVTTPKIARGAVTRSRLAPSAVNGSRVADRSLTLRDLAGANVAGAISFSLSAHGCGNLILSVAGARVGQAAVLTWTGTGNPPAGVVLGPLKVVSPDHLVVSACNLTDNAISESGVGVRVITLS